MILVSFLFKKKARKRNLEYISKYLKKHPCVDCGFIDIRALEFDYVRGKKIKPVTRMSQAAVSIENLKKEINKYDVRCANCHRIKHSISKNKNGFCLKKKKKEVIVQIPNIVESINKNMEAKIKRYPCHTTRASTIGYCVPMLDGCLRRGVYERTNWEDKALHEIRSQFIFDEGHLQERAVIKSINEAGFDLIEQQTPFTYEKEGQVRATGSIDGKIIVEDDGAGHPTVAVPVEIKSMHPMIFDTMHKFEDFKKKPWTHAYMAQITMYMLMQNIDKGIFFLKNKSDGRIRQINVDLDYELGEACLKTADDIHEHVKNGTLPDRIDNRDTCANCPFNHVCLPDLSFGTALKIADDPSYEQKLDDYIEIKDVAKEADKLWKEQIRPKAQASAENGTLNMIVGKHHLTGKTSVKGVFTLKVESS